MSTEHPTALWPVLYRERFGVTPHTPDAINPDCLDGKHRACAGTAWSDDLDALTDCLCDCHDTTDTEEHLCP